MRSARQSNMEGILLVSGPAMCDEPFLVWQAIGAIIDTFELLGWYTLEEEDPSEWRETAVKWLRGDLDRIASIRDKIGEAYVSESLEDMGVTDIQSDGRLGVIVKGGEPKVMDE